TLQVPQEFFGQMVQCPDCKHTFPAKPPEAAIQAEAPPAVPPSAVPAWQDAPPRPTKTHRRYEDEDDEDFDDRPGRSTDRRVRTGAPDRGGLILALGIISLVLALMSFWLYFIPISLIPITIGIVGWILGQRDLRAMRAGSMDATNQPMTLIGMI